MAASAHDIAAELRRRLPGLGAKKLHKLLYYCQGHHLATFDRPLFGETIAAWDMGPVVAALWRDEKNQQPPPPRRGLGEAELNTIGYVISRYGKLTGNDLENLSHGERPWQLADSNRSPQASATIRNEWIRDYFATTGAPTSDAEEPVFDSERLHEWLAESVTDERPANPDNLDSLRARFTSSV
ncbi:MULTISPECIES: Panacea domain-containing protein [Micromonospora]|uniref:Antitoxin SocA-like Panacea domain-containing protein n=1 Tax=Micromonospora yangpuensis TaxID=683228 RepID=A0A1C6U188_9ACTN|nr:Panacea domain-containing protein [Micromonospora yangpuensis]GGM11118.1 hypothetical protein GCM10012279_31430 [Micromonospora yangpuensis]SCL47835.1 Protein of unknown function [Micromonospora yangpuensis]